MTVRTDLFIPSRQDHDSFYRGNRRKNRWARILRILNRSSGYALVAIVSALLTSSSDVWLIALMMAGYMIVIGIGLGSLIQRLSQ